MKLNIYKGNKVVKTYEKDTYDLLFGVLEDVAAAINLDDLQTGTDMEIIKMAGNVVLHSMDTIKDLLKDVFDGITDDELRNTRVSEIIVVIVEIAKFTLTQLNKSFKPKN